MVRSSGQHRGDKNEDKTDTLCLPCPSRVTSSLQAHPPWTECSIQASQVCSSSRKVQGHVLSSTITTAVCGRADCSDKKCGTKVVYEGAESTMCTDNWTRISACDAQCGEGNVQEGREDNRPCSPSSRPLAQSYPNAKSVRGLCLLASADGFWRRVDTRVLLPVEVRGHSLLVSSTMKMEI